MKPWRTLEGTVVAGHGVASGQGKNSPFPSGTIAMQAPFFKALGLDLSHYYLATLNVDIYPFRFTINEAPHHFKGVKWSPEHQAEDFFLSPCRVIVIEKPYSALIYYPDPETKIDHFKNASTLEIIAPFIEGICYGSKITIEVNPHDFARRILLHIVISKSSALPCIKLSNLVRITPLARY